MSSTLTSYEITSKEESLSGPVLSYSKIMLRKEKGYFPYELRMPDIMPEEFDVYKSVIINSTELTPIENFEPELFCSYLLIPKTKSGVVSSGGIYLYNISDPQIATMEIITGYGTFNWFEFFNCFVQIHDESENLLSKFDFVTNSC